MIRIITTEKQDEKSMKSITANVFPAKKDFLEWYVSKYQKVPELSMNHKDFNKNDNCPDFAGKQRRTIYLQICLFYLVVACILHIEIDLRTVPSKFHRRTYRHLTGMSNKQSVFHSVITFITELTELK